MKKYLKLTIICLIALVSGTEIYAQKGGGGNNYYQDADGDGWGNPNVSSPFPLPGYVDNGTDCDDTDPNIGGARLWYIDADLDDFGEMTHMQSACTKPSGYADNNLDQCPGQYGTDNGCPLPTGPTPSENYIYNITFRNAFNKGSEGSAGPTQKIESIQYFDGLGRLMQSVGIRAGGGSEDIVTHMMYDSVGRQAKEYLPYAAQTNEGYYRSDALSATGSFYNTTKYESTFNPYSEKVFEPSPLNRAVEQAAPGNPWKVKTTKTNGKYYSNGKTIRMDYETNLANTVREYSVSLSFSINTYWPSLMGGTTYYAKGELTKTTTRDENWSELQTFENDHTTEEYKDKQGQVVLKRTYNQNIAHDTYYVYDIYGNLTYVIPPKVNTADGVSSTELDELCYQYKYDQRNRLVEKKIPGKGWEYIVYNKLDQPVLTRDQNLQSQNKWLFTKYDGLGRVVYTGEIFSSSNRSAMQNIVNGFTGSNSYEDRTGQILYSNVPLFYTYSSYPNYTGVTVFTVNYYDTYNINFMPSGAGTLITNHYGHSSASAQRGQVVMTQTRVIGTTSFIKTVSYYDSKGRVIRTYSHNEYLGTTDIVDHKLDAHTGRINETRTTHKKTGKSDIITVEVFTYDHMDRVTKHTHKVNSQAAELLAENTYDELGQLLKKGVGHVASNTTNRLQTIDYTYNIRGWLKTINQDAVSDNDLFNFTIRYNNPTTGTALYNGNISQTSWNTLSSDPSTKTYTYSYDGLNRIKSGIFTSTTTAHNGRYDLSTVNYDKNGNITLLSRKGHRVANPNINTSSHFGSMDYIYYGYYNGGNKLRSNYDSTGITYGFKDGSGSSNEYTYDANGNMKTDLNKNITNINYNHLNLPTHVVIGGKNIYYIYAADGTKLRKNADGTITDYAGNFVYENTNLQFFNHAEGYLLSSGGQYKYVYQYKDHLGNVRLSYRDTNGNGTILQGEIIEEKNYYPFGLTHKGYNDTTQPNGNGVAQRWGFTGKEHQDELDLGWIDITARNYDAALGRWMNIDPLAEQMRRHSPYNYAFDNPIFFMDPDGMAPVACCGGARTGPRPRARINTRRNRRLYSNGRARARATYIRESSVRLKEGARIESTKVANNVRKLVESNNLTPSDPSEEAGKAEGPGGLALKALELVAETQDFVKTVGIGEVDATNATGAPLTKALDKGSIGVKDFDTATKIMGLEMEYQKEFSSLMQETKIDDNGNEVPRYHKFEVMLKLGPSPVQTINAAVQESLKKNEAEEYNVIIKKSAQVNPSN